MWGPVVTAVQPQPPGAQVATLDANWPSVPLSKVSPISVAQGVCVAVGVIVGVWVTVAVRVTVFDGVAVLVAVAVGSVPVGVLVGVPMAQLGSLKLPMRNCQPLALVVGTYS